MAEPKETTKPKEGIIKFSFQTLILFVFAGAILMLFIRVKEFMTKIELLENAFSRLRIIKQNDDDETEGEEDDEE